MWRGAGRETKGKSHIRHGLECQDKTYIQSKGNSIAFALSDGAGSCEYSHYGAEEAIKCTTQMLIDNFDRFFNMEVEQFKEEVIENILTNIRNKYNDDINKFSGTLAFVAINSHRIISGNLGDGVVGILNSRNNMQVLFSPKNGEYKNQTYFFTSSKYKEVFDVFRGTTKNIKGFILMSDGASESLYSRENNTLANGNKIMIEWLDKYPINVVEDALEENLKKVFIEKTNDDCSIIIAKLYEINKLDSVQIYALKKKYKLNTINRKKLIKQINDREKIFNIFNREEITFNELLNKSNCKEKKLKRLVKRFLELNLINKVGNLYIKNN